MGSIFLDRTNVDSVCDFNVSGLEIYLLINDKRTLFKVLFPSGSKVVIRRNYWGLDLIIETPRASNINNEKGLCLYSGPNVKAQVDIYGYNLR